MIKKLIIRLAISPLDGLMLVAGLLGGLGGSFLAVRAAEHKNAPLEITIPAADTGSPEPPPAPGAHAAEK